jgi:hypothetical protein
VTFYHLSKFLKWSESLPLKRITPVIKEPSGPAFALVISELCE